MYLFTKGAYRLFVNLEQLYYGCYFFANQMIISKTVNKLFLKVVGNENGWGLGGWLLFEEGSDRGDRCLFAF
jgi:hypothetical protein